MGKIYILGNKQSISWANRIDALTKIEIPTLAVNDSQGINNFVIETLKDVTCDDKIIIDLDATSNGILSLMLAMYIRMSVSELQEKAFLPILLVSYLLKFRI